MSRGISESPLDFEITRVNCSVNTWARVNNRSIKYKVYEEAYKLWALKMPSEDSDQTAWLRRLI